jgi:hypothetical protein
MGSHRSSQHEGTPVSVLRRAVVLDQWRAADPPGDPPHGPRAAAAAQALQAGRHRTAITPRQPAVLKAPQHGIDPCTTAGVIGRRLELHGLRTRQHLAHLPQCGYLRLVHVDQHPFDDRPAPPAGCPPARPQKRTADLSLPPVSLPSGMPHPTPGSHLVGQG